MAGDIPLHEQVLVGEQPFMPPQAPPGARGGPAPSAIHHYGRRVHIIGSAQPWAPGAAGPAGLYGNADAVPRELTGALNWVESLGLAALRLRQSAAYQAAKQQRPRQGEPWNMPGGCTEVTPMDRKRAAEARAPKFYGTGTSSFLCGSVAVGVILVSGPTAELQFSDAEVVKIVAEVQNGLSWYPTVSPGAQVSFTYDIQHVRITAPSNPNAADLEAVWRDPAMAALGYAASFDGVYQYIAALRTRFATRWTYCGFFMKYPAKNFAYAGLGGPRVVVQYPADNWGPENLDRVFAHETGHIFQCPDEYAESACDCGGIWGRYGAPNGNCARCAPGGGVACLMKDNTWGMCNDTPLHLGFPAPWPMLQSDAYVGLRNLAGTGKGQLLVHTYGAGGGPQRAATLRQVAGGAGLEVGWSAFASLPGGWSMDVSDVYLDVGDVDGDGKTEVLVQSRHGGQASIALMRYEPSLGGPLVGRVTKDLIPGGWRMNVGDEYLALGDIDGDGKAEVLVRSKYTGDRFIGLLRYDPGTQALKAVWIIDTVIPGGWRMNQSDAYLMAGDLDGDGKTELVVRSQYEGTYRYIGLVRYDAATHGLRASWITDTVLPGGWKMNQSDAYLYAGDLDADGKSELVVRSQYLGPRYLGVLRYDAATHGLKADSIVQNTLAGGWNLLMSDACLLAGDLDGDGRTELVIQSRHAGDRYVGLLRYDAATRGLRVDGLLQNVIPGGWNMNQTDLYLLAGDVDGNGRSDLIVRSQYAGDRYLGVVRYDPVAGGLLAPWIVQNVIPGSIAAAPGQAAPSAEVQVPPIAATEEVQPRPHA